VHTTRSQSPPFGRTIASDINQLSQLLALEPGDLLRRRPDIRAAEARLHAATARVGVAVAQLFPSVSFDLPFGTQAETFPKLADWASRFYSIGPSLTLPIFEAGSWARISNWPISGKRKPRSTMRELC
jgi:outer membrane protein TolC